MNRMLRVPGFRVNEVNRVKNVVLTPSGKATNAARVLHRLGAAHQLITLVGGPTGDRFVRAAEEEGLSCLAVRCRGETRIVQTLMDEAGGTATEIVEEMEAPEPDEWEEFEARIAEALPGASVMAVCGKLPPASAPEGYAGMAALARDRAVPWLIDSQGPPVFHVLRHGPLMVKMNEMELEWTVPGGRTTEDRAAQLLDGGARNVLITRGASPVFWVSDVGIKQVHVPGLIPVNPIGSGDSMVGGITCMLQQGKPLGDAIAYGVACGSANALTERPGDVSAEEVARLLPEVRID